MDRLEAPTHPECTVPWIEILVLQLSRVVGLAPVHIRTTSDGWRIRVAHNYRFYGELVAVLSGFISMIVLVIDMTLYKDSSLNAKTNANRMVWIVDVLIVMVVVIIGAYTGISRMHCMIDSFVELEQLNEELKSFRQPTFKNNRIELMVLSSITFTVILAFTDYLYAEFQTVVHNGKVILSSFYILNTIALISLHLLVIQFFLITMTILATLKELNNCFGDVLLDLQKNKSLVSSLTTLYIKTVYNADDRIIKTNQVSQKQFYDTSMTILEGVKSVPTRLNCLIRIYTVMSDIIQRIERSHGGLLVMTVLSFLLHLLITLYHFLCGIIYPELTDLPNTLLQVPWFIHLVVKTAMVIEPCHRTHDQLNKTKDLFAHMIRYIRDDDFAIIAEIKSFFRHYTLYRGKYSPMQFFTLNRTIIVSISGSIITYLIIVIQMTKSV